MISKNKKGSKPCRLVLDLSNKISLRRSNKQLVLSHLSMYYTSKSIKKAYKNNKFKISGPTWNKKFGLYDGSYSVSRIQDYLEYIKNRQIILQ